MNYHIHQGDPLQEHVDFCLGLVGRIITVKPEYKLLVGRILQLVKNNTYNDTDTDLQTITSRNIMDIFSVVDGLSQIPMKIEDREQFEILKEDIMKIYNSSKIGRILQSDLIKEVREINTTLQYLIQKSIQGMYIAGETIEGEKTIANAPLYLTDKTKRNLQENILKILSRNGNIDKTSNAIIANLIKKGNTEEQARNIIDTSVSSVFSNLENMVNEFDPKKVETLEKLAKSYENQNPAKAKKIFSFIHQMYVAQAANDEHYYKNLHQILTDSKDGDIIDIKTSGYDMFQIIKWKYDPKNTNRINIQVKCKRKGSQKEEIKIFTINKIDEFHAGWKARLVSKNASGIPEIEAINIHYLSLIQNKGQKTSDTENIVNTEVINTENEANIDLAPQKKISISNVEKNEFKTLEEAIYNGLHLEDIEFNVEGYRSFKVTRVNPTGTSKKTASIIVEIQKNAFSQKHEIKLLGETTRFAKGYHTFWGLDKKNIEIKLPLNIFDIKRKGAPENQVSLWDKFKKTVGMK